MAQKVQENLFYKMQLCT